LRAIAVLAVLLFHAGLSPFAGGYVGVDVFFVLSGYLITGIVVKDLEAGTFSLIRFYERRARRILPALFLVILVCTGVAWIVLVPSDLALFGRSVAAVTVFASNVLFWKEAGYFDTEAHLKPLLHTWSLGVEEQFYLFFPIALLLLWKLRRRWRVIAIILVALASLALAQRLVATQPTMVFYLLPTRAWELLIGGLLAFAPRRQFSPLVADGAALAGLGLILASVFLFDSATPFPSVYALVPTIGTALVIAFASPATLVGRLLSTRLMVGIGLVSYSAYLWHQPLVVFARHIDLAGPSLVAQTALSLAAIPLAYLSWRFVEQPFRDSKRFSRRSIFVMAFVGSAVVAGAGLLAMRSGKSSFAAPPPVDGGLFSCARDGDAPCVLGNANAKTAIVLVGDSHAHQLLAAIVDVFGTDRAIIPVICNSCFFGEKVRFDRDAEFPAELERNRRTIALLKNYSIDLVIRSQRWHGYGIDGPDEIRHAVDDARTFYGVPYRDLVIVGSTANVDFRCHVARALGKPRIGSCNDDPTSRENVTTFAATTRVMTGVRFVYPHELLCRGSCKVVDENTVYYRDTHHLSDAGALLVAREIQRLMAM
jgi:peptidoglycan/LPS O-acetylase OafA/YrhL